MTSLPPKPRLPSDPEPTKKTRSALWVTSTYFAEGYPYSAVINASEILFKEFGASYAAVGLTAAFHLPWNLKLLWGPLLDAYETKRRWLLAVEVALCGVFALLTGSMLAQDVLTLASVAFLAMAFVAATHDIAIDGFYMEALDEEGRSRFVGFRTLAYRAATVVIISGLPVVVDWTSWFVGWLAATGVMVAVTVLHFAILPKVEVRRLPWTRLMARALGRRTWIVLAAIAVAIELERRFMWLRPAWEALRARVATTPVIQRFSASDWIGLSLFTVLVLGLAALPWLVRRLERSDSAYARAYVDFLAQRKIGLVLALVVSFRAGESFLLKMKYPFFDDEVGLGLAEYGMVNGASFLASAGATLLGGVLISKHGLRRWLWPFVIAQNVLNLLYMAVAALPDPSSIGPMGAAVVMLVENVGAGLGTSVFMIYIMRCCDPRHKAAHFAILTALMSLGFTFAGIGSGFLAEALGFSLYFGFTFVATIPSMILLFFVPHIDGREE